MECFPVLLAFFITSSGCETAALNNYVTPNKTIGCSNGEVSCLTLQEYICQSDVHFMNDTIVYFKLGSHIYTLNSSLKIHKFA